MVYTPHKILEEDIIENIKIFPCPLYANNFENPDDNIIFQNIDFKEKERKLLYSFQGAYIEGLYLTDTRKRIFEMKHPDNTFIKNTGIWHFEKIVYSEKQNINNEKNKDLNNINNTNSYNQVLLNSRYSLCPSGSGPNTIRFWESLAIGSIPILLADTLELPAHELWDDTILIVPEKDLNIIPDILSKISTEKEKSMRENCITIYNFFKNNYTNRKF
jgi:hypothetical protein